MKRRTCLMYLMLSLGILIGKWHFWKGAGMGMRQRLV
jgi:hypothetical protein